MHRTNRYWHLILATLICLHGPGWTCLADESAGRFVAHWQDGTTARSADLGGWNVEDKSPGHGRPSKIERATLDGRRLFEAENPVKYLYHTSRAPQLADPFIQFTNGDILPGRVLPITDSNPRFVTAAAFRPLATRLDHDQVRVRCDSIARIAFMNSSRQALTPGLVRFRDGGKVIARRIRWTAGGFRLLLNESVENVAWDQLAEVHFPHPNSDVIDAVLRDASAQSTGGLDLLGRLTTSNGAVLTCHLARVCGMKSGSSYAHLLQPAWAQNGILVPTDEIAAIAYRNAAEVPLSLLPARTLAEENLTGYTWRWKRNRNVRGGPLSVGGTRAGLGVGTHSHSEIDFALPPGAISFSCRVGVDDSMRRGGCVRCKVFRNEVEGAPAWDSRILEGGERAAQIERLDVRNAQRLVLVTEFAHEGRPAGADPLDIRDTVAWLDASVRVDLAPVRSADVEWDEAIPQLRGWTMTESMQRRLTLRPQFVASQGRWAHAMVLGDASPEEFEPLVLAQVVDVNLHNAWLLKAPGRDETGSVGFRVTVHADGEQVKGTEGYDGDTTGYRPGTFDRVAHSLGKYQGQRVTLKVTAHPARDDYQNLTGIVWDELSLKPLIEGLPPDGQPVRPDVPLEAIDSLRLVSRKGTALQLADDSADKPPVSLRHFRMASGLEIPPSLERVTCRLDPRWKRFVACIGPAGPSHGTIESFQVWIDKELLWQSGNFTRLSRPRQIELRLPDAKPGALLTLRVVNKSRNHAAWALAGFMLE